MAEADLHDKPVMFLAEDDFWAPFFDLVRHTIDAKLTPASFAKAYAPCALDRRMLQRHGLRHHRPRRALIGVAARQLLRNT